MDDAEFRELVAAIHAGGLSASQMEDVVYAMHSAYVDHEPKIYQWLPTSLEDTADALVVARSNSELI